MPAQEPKPGSIEKFERDRHHRDSCLRLSVRARRSEMKVRITNRPRGTWEGEPLKKFVTGKTYEITRSMGDYLLLQGYGVVERRLVGRITPEDSGEGLGDLLKSEAAAEKQVPARETEAGEGAEKAMKRLSPYAQFWALTAAWMIGGPQRNWGSRLQ